jgi:hypothetical protein
VSNVGPTVNAGTSVTINEGVTFTRSGSFSDPGPTDTWIATVDFGDGDGAIPLHLNADKTFNLHHVYQKDGIFTVYVVVADSHGGKGIGSFTVTVNNIGIVGWPYPVNPGWRPTYFDHTIDSRIVDSVLFNYGWDFSYGTSSRNPLGPAPMIPRYISSSSNMIDSMACILNLRVTVPGTFAEASTPSAENTIFSLPETSAAQTEKSDDTLYGVDLSAIDPLLTDAKITAVSYSFDGGSFVPGLPGMASITGGISLTGTTGLNSLVASYLSGIAGLEAGTYVIRLTITDENGGISYATTTIVVHPEDVRAAYTGPSHVATPARKNGKAMVHPRTIIRDIPPAWSATDLITDISAINTIGTFVNGSADNGVNAGMPVFLLDSEDWRTGGAVYDWQVDSGSKDFKVYYNGMVVGGNYHRNSSLDDVIMTAVRPLNGAITTDSNLVNKGLAGHKTDVGFNVKSGEKHTKQQGESTAAHKGGNDNASLIKANAIDSVMADIVRKTADNVELGSSSGPFGIDLLTVEGNNSNSHSKWHLGGKDESPEAYTQYVEDGEDAANDSDTINANLNKTGHITGTSDFTDLGVLMMGSLVEGVRYSPKGMDHSAQKNRAGKLIGNGERSWFTDFLKVPDPNKDVKIEL